MTDVESLVLSVGRVAAGEGGRVEFDDGSRADAGYRRDWMDLRDAAGRVVARGDWRAGAQGAPYPDWHREVVLEALRQCADRPRPAAELLVGRLVEVLAGGVAGATEVPLLLVGADATCIVVERRDGVLAAIPWGHIYAVRARERACRMCGCTDREPCSDGCCWVEVDLCSACEEWAEFEAEADAAEGSAGAACHERCPRCGATHMQYSDGRSMHCALCEQRDAARTSKGATG